MKFVLRIRGTHSDAHRGAVLHPATLIKFSKVVEPSGMLFSSSSPLIRAGKHL